jgi:hypothetical protein
MNSARRLVWFVLVLGVLLAISMGLWLSLLYSGSMAQLPSVLTRFGRAIAEAEDISTLKTACLMLAEVNEGERLERLQFLLVSAGAAIVSGLLSAGACLRLLSLLKGPKVPGSN